MSDEFKTDGRVDEYLDLEYMSADLKVLKASLMTAFCKQTLSSFTGIPANDGLSHILNNAEVLAEGIINRCFVQPPEVEDSDEVGKVTGKLFVSYQYMAYPNMCEGFGSTVLDLPYYSKPSSLELCLKGLPEDEGDLEILKGAVKDKIKESSPLSSVKVIILSFQLLPGNHD